MFFLGTMASQVISLALEAKAEQDAFESSLVGLPEEEVTRLRAERREAQKERQRRYEDERRHRDLCDAIESTSFWNFGSSKRSRW